MLCFNPDCSRCSGWCRKSTGLSGFFGVLVFFLSLSLWMSLSQTQPGAKSCLRLPMASSAPIAVTVCSVTAWAIT